MASALVVVTILEILPARPRAWVVPGSSATGRPRAGSRSGHPTPRRPAASTYRWPPIATLLILFASSQSHTDSKPSVVVAKSARYSTCRRPRPHINTHPTTPTLRRSSVAGRYSIRLIGSLLGEARAPGAPYGLARAVVDGDDLDLAARLLVLHGCLAVGDRHPHVEWSSPWSWTPTLIGKMIRGRSIFSSVRPCL